MNFCFFCCLQSDQKRKKERKDKSLTAPDLNKVGDLRLGLGLGLGLLLLAADCEKSQ